MISNMASKPSKNKPGPLDDIGRAASLIKRGLISNPSNANNFSNLDKALGRSDTRSITQMPSDIAKIVGKGITEVKKDVDYLLGKKTSTPIPSPTNQVIRGMNQSGQVVSPVTPNPALGPIGSIKASTVASKKSPFGSATAAVGITKDKKGNVTSALFPETKKAASKKKK